MNSNIRKLKSGSDIRGIAIGENKNFSNDDVKNLSVSFAIFLEKFKGIRIKDQTISVGHDSRLSSERFYKIFLNSLSSIGVDTYACGLCSTPAISCAPNILSCSASVEITASHHPKEYNGFKFFTKDSGLSSFDIDAIIEISENEFYPKSNRKGIVHEFNLMKNYSDILKNKIKSELKDEKPLEGLKIVVDASNGAGGFFVNEILNPLGANTQGSKLLDPDGNFPSHSPNPEKEESIKSIIESSIKNNADLGIIFDADVDRCFFVDDKGEPIVKNRFVSLVSKLILKENPESTIVTDSVTSDHLKEFIEDNGGFQFRERRGYHNVISAAKKLNELNENCYLAIETSGHAAFKENDFKDDGAYLSVKIIIELVKMKKNGGKLSDFVKDFKDAKESKEYRFSFKNSEQIDDMISFLKENFHHTKGCKIDENTPEGIRMNFDEKHGDGWCLIRRSAHDLSIVLNIESDSDGGVEKIFQNIDKLMLTKKDDDGII